MIHGDCKSWYMVIVRGDTLNHQRYILTTFSEDYLGEIHNQIQGLSNSWWWAIVQSDIFWDDCINYTEENGAIRDIMWEGKTVSWTLNRIIIVIWDLEKCWWDTIGTIEQCQIDTKVTIETPWKIVRHWRNYWDTKINIETPY